MMIIFIFYFDRVLGGKKTFVSKMLLRFGATLLGSLPSEETVRQGLNLFS